MIYTKKCMCTLAPCTFLQAGCSATEARWLTQMMILGLVFCCSYLVLSLLCIIRLTHDRARPDTPPRFAILARLWWALAGVALLGWLILGQRPAAPHQIGHLFGLSITTGPRDAFPLAPLLGPLAAALLGGFAWLSSKHPRSSSLRRTFLVVLCLPLLLGAGLGLASVYTHHQREEEGRSEAKKARQTAAQEIERVQQRLHRIQEQAQHIAP